VGRKYGINKYGAFTYDLLVSKPIDPWLPVPPILDPWIPISPPPSSGWGAAPIINDPWIPIVALSSSWGDASTKNNTWVPVVNPTPVFQVPNG
jgi:hypothetical protein